VAPYLRAQRRRCRVATLSAGWPTSTADKNAFIKDVESDRTDLNVDTASVGVSRFGL
jgi:hypothetical protein